MLDKIKSFLEFSMIRYLEKVQRNYEVDDYSKGYYDAMVAVENYIKGEEKNETTNI